MNTIKLNSLTTDVAVYQQNGEFYFDLLDLAERMGYRKPRVAINNFAKRKCPSLESDSIWYDNKLLAPERHLYRFLISAGLPLEEGYLAAGW